MPGSRESNDIFSRQQLNVKLIVSSGFRRGSVPDQWIIRHVHVSYSSTLRDDVIEAAGESGAIGKAQSD